MKKSLLAGSVVVFACLTLAGCGGGSSGSSRQVEVRPPAKEPIASPNDVYKQLESTTPGTAGKK
ncbi:MAG: hypothetical protein KDA22_14490 [Phycisphaerales bacterium]|nr:hypothetical protein [Phycisphaerales bacterium]